MNKPGINYLTKTIRLFILLFGMAVLTLNAQEKKAFTLEDVIPGGNNYFNLIPQRIPALSWWGDVCIRAEVEEVKTVNTKSGKETVLFTLPQINKELSANGIKQLRTLMNVSFPWAERSEIVFRHDNTSIIYDFKTHKIVSRTPLKAQGAEFDFCPANRRTAYIAGNGLFVDDKQINPGNEGKGIVYGQAVHRNEFGITKGTFWSPKGNYLAFYRMDQSMVTDYPQVNTSLRVATLEADKYPMAGMTSHKVSVGIYNINSGKTIYLQTEDPTDRYFTNISWSPSEQHIYVIELNRDQNHARLVRYNVNGEKEAVIYEEKHPKYTEPLHPLAFLPWDDTKFIYWSQRSGFQHLYICDTQKEMTGEWKQGDDGASFKENIQFTSLTQGDWLVQEIIGFNAAQKEVIIGSTEISPLQTNIFSVNTKTGKRTLIGKENGTHTARLSASGKFIIDRFNSFDVAGETGILPTNGKKGVNLLTATDPLKEKYELPEITIGTIKAADGVTDLYYRLIKPVGFDENKKYPAIIYVYGGPHAQLIHNTRFYDARGWDLYMAQKGYVMLTVDSRGSDNRGARFENCTFRRLGVEEMKDQLKGVDLLKSLPYVDAARIGVHGWSYGGFMTTNLMLTYPEVFKAGVAGGPVIDWKYYEVMYGERYMDTPQTNPEGYKGSDLKQKAGNLKGRLEIIIGGTDPVCVPQHTYTFLRSCIDAGTHPDLFIYPEDGHNMMGRDRVHLHEHITRYFEDHLK